MAQMMKGRISLLALIVAGAALFSISDSASAQGMDASAQTDEDLRKRGKAAKHDKKHKTHGAHGVATLGTDISQRKIDKLHRQLGEHAPAYKPKPHALKKTHPAHRKTGSHAVISSKSAQAAGRWGYPEPAIDFVGIAQRNPNGPSSFVGPDNRRLTNSEMANLYNQGIITPRGLPAVGQAQTVRFVPAGMFTPPEPRGITAPNTATSQLSKTELLEQIQTNPNGLTAFVANRLIFGYQPGERLRFKDLVQVYNSINTDGSISGLGADAVVLRPLQSGSLLEPPKPDNNQVPTPGAVQAPTPPRLGNNEVPTLGPVQAPTPPLLSVNEIPKLVDLDQLAAARPDALSPYIVTNTLGNLQAGQRLTYAQAHGFRNFLAENGSVLPQFGGTLRYLPQSLFVAPPQLGNNQIPAPGVVRAPTPPQLGNSEVPTTSGNISRPPTLGQNLTPPEPIIGQRTAPDFAGLAATNPTGQSNYFTQTLGRYLTHQEILGLSQRGAILPNGNVAPVAAGAIRYLGPNYITAPTPPRLGNNQVPTPGAVQAPTPPQLGNNQVPTSGAVQLPKPPQLGSNQVPTPSGTIARPPTLGQNLTPPEPIVGQRTAPDFAGLAATNPTGQSNYYTQTLGRYLTHQEILGLVQQGVILPDGNVTPVAAGAIQYLGPNYTTAPTPPQLGNNQVPTPGAVQAPTPPRFGNNQVPTPRPVQTQTPLRLGNNQVPTPSAGQAPTPLQLGNNQVPSLILKSQIGTMSALQIASLSNPNGQSSYSTALGNRLTNKQAFALEQIGMIFTNGQPTSNAIILSPNGTATSVQVTGARLPTLNSIASISPNNDREVSKEHRFSNAVVREGKLALAIYGVRQPDYDLCPMSLRDPETLKCNLDGRKK